MESNTTTAVETSLEAIVANAEQEAPKRIAKNRIVDVPLDDIVTMVPGWNVRKATIESHTNPDVETIAVIGQKEAGLVYRVSQRDLDTWAKKFAGYVKAGQYLPIRGNIRSTKMKQFREKKMIDPLTVRKGDDGKIIEGSGKVFSTFRAEVVENLDEQSVFSLMNDHTSKKLTQEEVYLALERAIQLYATETEAAVNLYGLLLSTSRTTPSEKQMAIHTPEGREEWKKFCKGRIDTAKRLIRCPIILREAFYKTIRKEDTRPNNDEFKMGCTIHDTEMKEATAKMDLSISRATPGPKFMEWWQKLQTELQTAAEEGRKPKAQANKNASQIEDLLQGYTSKILRMGVFVVQNKTTGDQNVELNRIVFEIEQHLSPEHTEMLDKLLESIKGHNNIVPDSEEAAK